MLLLRKSVVFILHMYDQNAAIVGNDIVYPMSNLQTIFSFGDGCADVHYVLVSTKIVKFIFCILKYLVMIPSNFYKDI